MIRRILKAIIAKKAETFAEPKKHRIDDSWPLGIKLGRTVNLEETPFLLADGTIVKFPGLNHVIKAVGIARISIATGVKIYRLYLENIGASEDKESVLQIAVDEKSDEVLECILYRQYVEICPQTVDEWAIWLNENNGIIGYKDMSTPNELTYSRVTPDGGNKVAPFAWREYLTDDPYREEIASIDYQSAVYGRSLGEDGTEYLLVSQITDNEGSYIRILVGIPMDADFIKIL